jgi:phosphotriesterase-related protein
VTAFAQAVTGPRPAAELGLTLMHEHILCDLRRPEDRGPADRHPAITCENRFETDYFQNRNPLNMFLDEDDAAIAGLVRFRDAGGGTVVELTIGGIEPQPLRLRAIAGLVRFRDAGGGTVVELTIGGIEPQPLRLRAIAEASGVAVIAGAGFYVDAYLDDETRALAPDAIETVIQGQLADGLWGTDVRAGLIGEIGCSWPLVPVERRVLEAAARVSARTGAALTIHPGRHEEAPREIAGIVLAAGGDPARTVIGHMDRTLFDRERVIELLRLGFVLEWDFFGIETSQYWMAGTDLDLPTDYMRLDLLRDLVDRGYRDQLCLSHDICTRTRLCAHGGHGYRHLPAHVVPLMQRRGFTESEIEALLVETPRRLLAYL